MQTEIVNCLNGAVEKRNMTAEEITILELSRTVDVNDLQKQIQIKKRALFYNYSDKELACHERQKSMLVLEPLCVTCKWSDAQILQVYKWAQAVQDIKPATATIADCKVALAALTALEPLYPYTTQNDYDADALGFRV